MIGSISIIDAKTHSHGELLYMSKTMGVARIAETRASARTRLKTNTEEREGQNAYV